MMKDFAGKIAFITGGASGAGLGQAKVFSKAGMKVAIADVRQDALDNAVKELTTYGAKKDEILALKVDLTNREEYTAAADKVEQVFGGPPHLLIHTAGVNSFGPTEASTFDDYDWVMGVCLGAVVNGLVIFVPRMIKAYAGKTSFHVAATSSLGALSAGAITTPYSAAKAAVNSLMYSYNDALRPYGGGATVVCPGNINTNIGNTEKFRPAQFKNTGYHVTDETMGVLNQIHAHGMDPVELGERMKKAIEDKIVLCLPYDDSQERLRELLDYEFNYSSAEGMERNRELDIARAKAREAEMGLAPNRMDVGFGKAKSDAQWVDPNRRV
jgi:NAD(P)-dependent dehydrogenase (short-subunit alcohol dehydrogenase family)